MTEPECGRYTEETSMELRIDKKCVLSECRTKKINNMSLPMCVHVMFVKLIFPPKHKCLFKESHCINMKGIKNQI